jgi:hypothetical protein
VALSTAQRRSGEIFWLFLKGYDSGNAQIRWDVTVDFILRSVERSDDKQRTGKDRGASDSRLTSDRTVGVPTSVRTKHPKVTCSQR